MKKDRIGKDLSSFVPGITLKPTVSMPRSVPRLTKLGGLTIDATGLLAEEPEVREETCVPSMEERKKVLKRLAREAKRKVHPPKKRKVSPPNPFTRSWYYNQCQWYMKAMGCKGAHSRMKAEEMRQAWETLKDEYALYHYMWEAE